MSPDDFKLLHWDIEATDLNANWGTILCIGYKFNFEKKPTVISILDDPRFKKDHRWINSERWVLDQFYEKFLEADAHCTWYGSRYDMPFCNTKRVFYKDPIFPPTPHIDLWRTSRYQLKMSNNRLESCGDYFFHESIKTRVKPIVWRKASVGHAPSIKYVVNHCDKDIVELERMHDIMRPLIKNYPSSNAKTGDLEACSKCGGKKIHRGTGQSIKRIYDRYQCKGCGSWSSGNYRNRGLVGHTF